MSSGIEKQYKYDTVEEALNSDEFKQNSTGVFENEDIRVEVLVDGSTLKYIFKYKLSIAPLGEYAREVLKKEMEQDSDGRWEDTFMIMFRYIRTVVRNNWDDFRMEVISLDIDGIKLGALEFTSDTICVNENWNLVGKTKVKKE